jgi:hypothetical protein
MTLFSPSTTFGILTTKMYTKLASIEIYNLSPNSKNVKNKVKIQKFEKKIILNFLRNFREGRSLVGTHNVVIVVIVVVVHIYC